MHPVWCNDALCQVRMQLLGNRDTHGRRRQDTAEVKWREFSEKCRVTAHNLLEYEPHRCNSQDWPSKERGSLPPCSLSFVSGDWEILLRRLIRWRCKKKKSPPQNCLAAIFIYFWKFCQVLKWIFKLDLQLILRAHDALYTKCWILTKDAHKPWPGTYSCLLP